MIIIDLFMKQLISDILLSISLGKCYKIGINETYSIQKFTRVRYQVGESRLTRVSNFCLAVPQCSLQLLSNDSNSRMPDYFVTAGYGLDHYAVKEINLLSDTEITEVITGKVFFTSLGDPAELLSLKTVERLFVQVLHVKIDSNVEINAIENWIQDQIAGENILWTNILDTFKKFVNIDPHSQIKFRVNSRLTGKFRKPELYLKVSNIVGKIFSNHFDVLSELYQPDLEIFFHLNESYLTVGLPLTKRPLSDRSYLKHIAVRSTVCCALCIAANVTIDDSVLDPMCGAATILIESIKQFNVKWAVGIDNDVNQLKLAKENLERSGAEVALILGDSTKCFVKETFDVVICDVPFGRKFGTQNQIKPLLKSVLKTIDFLLKANGRVVILISEELCEFVLDSTKNWNLIEEKPLRLGRLSAVILSWRK